MHPVARAARRCLIKQAQLADLVDAEAFVLGFRVHHCMHVSHTVHRLVTTATDKRPECRPVYGETCLKTLRNHHACRQCLLGVDQCA